MLTLSAQTTWVSDTLKVLFRKGLSHELKSELACHDEGRDLNQFIELTIQIDNLIRARKPSTHNTVRVPTPTVAEEAEPMQINSYRLSAEERDRRLSQRLCLYCGQSGHLRSSCPSQPHPKS